jgi:RNase P subunit RPR2
MKRLKYILRSIFYLHHFEYKLDDKTLTVCCRKCGWEKKTPYER